jgi:ubiquinone/menaquinone biosynthesis C-methylase UbiE
VCRQAEALRHLGREVTAIGVDLDPEMVATARSRWPAGEFHVADATALPLDDGSVTGYRADKVLHTLPGTEPARAVAEARQVLARNGRAVLVGQDWDTFVIDSDQPALTRAAVHARADAVPNPRIARPYRTSCWTRGSLTSPPVFLVAGARAD